MASVQELILAANAKRDESPLIGLVKSLAGGIDSYQAAKSTAIQDLVRQKAAQKAQQEIEFQNRLKQRKIEQDAADKNAFNSIAPRPASPIPAGRFQERVIEGKDGYEVKVIEPKNTSLEDRLGAMVDSGQMTIEQAFQLKNRSGGGIQTAPSGFRYKPDGTLEPIPGGPAESKQTESQSNSRLFGTRADEANGQINKLLDSGQYDPSSIASVKNKIPDVVGGNLLRSKEAQIYDQAKTNFLTAVLRKESGATIQPSEFEVGDKQYFPVTGDSPEVIAQKRQNRETAIRLIQSAGGINKQSGSNSNVESKIIGGTGANMDKAIMKIGAPVSQPSGATWDDSKESRYQELLRKRGGK